MPSLTHTFNLSKPVNQYFHIFRNNNIHSFMITLTRKRHHFFAYILFAKPRKRIYNGYHKWWSKIIYICANIRRCTHSFHRHMILFVVFSYSTTLQSMLVYYVVTGMGCFDDYSDSAPHAKTMRGNGITTFILNVDQCITLSHKKCYSNTYFWVMVEVIIFKVRLQDY